ncbi:MAG: hypothetical protein ACREV4_13425 [Gammaproteobacteria bacterium]
MQGIGDVVSEEQRTLSAINLIVTDEYGHTSKCNRDHHRDIEVECRRRYRDACGRHEATETQIGKMLKILLPITLPTAMSR